MCVCALAQSISKINKYTSVKLKVERRFISKSSAWSANTAVNITEG